MPFIVLVLCLFRALAISADALTEIAVKAFDPETVFRPLPVFQVLVGIVPSPANPLPMLSTISEDMSQPEVVRLGLETSTGTLAPATVCQKEFFF